MQKKGALVKGRVVAEIAEGKAFLNMISRPHVKAHTITNSLSLVNVLTKECR
ncbi:hypothetical protein LMG33818_001205 [Halomonadaceae bacterium LMG 33818]